MPKISYPTAFGVLCHAARHASEERWQGEFPRGMNRWRKPERIPSWKIVCHKRKTDSPSCTRAVPHRCPAGNLPCQSCIFADISPLQRNYQFRYNRSLFHPIFTRRESKTSYALSFCRALHPAAPYNYVLHDIYPDMCAFLPKALSPLCPWGGLTSS